MIEINDAFLRAELLNFVLIDFAGCGDINSNITTLSPTQPISLALGDDLCLANHSVC